MADLFGSILGAGMNPAITDLYKRSKKQMSRGMTPMVPKKDGSVGPGQQAAPKPDNIWSRIVSGFDKQRQY